jgi:hypothetical protein
LEPRSDPFCLFEAIVSFLQKFDVSFADVLRRVSCPTMRQSIGAIHLRQMGEMEAPENVEASFFVIDFLQD